jgi:hypothetical protein
MFRKLLRRPVKRVFWRTLRDPSVVHARLGNYDPREHGCGLRCGDGRPKMLWNARVTHGLAGIRCGDHLEAPLRELIADSFFEGRMEPVAAAVVSTARTVKRRGATVPSATKTPKHDTIKRWAEERDGHAAIGAALRAGDEAGILRIDFARADLERSGWERFFETFAQSRVASSQHETASGQASRVFKLARRN